MSLRKDDAQRALAQLLVAAISEKETQLGTVSRLLHDEVGQVLSAVGLQLDVLRLDLAPQAPEIVPRTLEIQQLLERAMAQIRDLSNKLSSTQVERVGLQFALERLVGRFREGFDGSLRLFCDSSVHLPLAVASPMYKLTERALENAVKHSKAAQVEVLLRPKQGAVVLEVRDNGLGFTRDEANWRFLGIGLLMMEYYATQAGATLQIETAPGKGTIVRTSYQER